MCGLGWFFCACQGLRKIVFARDGTSKLEAEAELEHTVGLTIWVSLGKEIEQFLDLHFDLVPHTTELGEVPRIDGRWVCCFNPSAETRREGGGNTVRRTVRVTNTTRVGCMKYYA
mmetsp:Transcript_87537/g.248884  ORF Transcript_87537/g.248884 Transcript_87537/m.248884 type:complete len:115 (-) Transcript_87537:813-1157(-)